MNRFVLVVLALTAWSGQSLAGDDARYQLMVERLKEGKFVQTANYPDIAPISEKIRFAELQVASYLKACTPPNASGQQPGLETDQVRTGIVVTIGPISKLSSGDQETSVQVDYSELISMDTFTARGCTVQLPKTDGFFSNKPVLLKLGIPVVVASGKVNDSDIQISLLMKR